MVPGYLSIFLVALTALLGGWDPVPSLCEYPAAGMGPGRRQGQGGCLHDKLHMPAQTPSRNTHSWGKAKAEVTECLFSQFPPPCSISGKRSGIHIPTVVKKKPQQARFWNSRNRRHRLLRAEKGWQILLEIPSAKNVKGNHLKNSNLPCTRGLFCHVYHKQNWLHLIIYLPILRKLGQNSK